MDEQENAHFASLILEMIDCRNPATCLCFDSGEPPQPCELARRHTCGEEFMPDVPPLAIFLCERCRPFYEFWLSGVGSMIRSTRR
jgi:hypothetical protein